MKSTFLINLLLFITLSCFSQDSEYDTLPAGINSSQTIRDYRIDSIIITRDFQGQKGTRYFTFDTMGKTTSIITLDDLGNKIMESLFIYNNDGNLIEKIDNEDMDGIKIETKWICFYNNIGQATKLITVIDRKDTIKTTLTYGTNERIQESRSNKGERILINYKYDERNKLIETTGTFFNENDSNGTIGLHTQIFYNPYGNKILELVSFSTVDTIVYKYNNNNKLVSIQKRKSTEKYFYNESGLISKREIIRSSPDQSYFYSEFYRYVIRD